MQEKAKNIFSVMIVMLLLTSLFTVGVTQGVDENSPSAEIEEEMHELTLDYDPEVTHLVNVNETYEIEPGHTFTFEDNTTVNIGAFPVHGWAFNEWIGNTENIENFSSSDTTITMEDDYHIEPEFVKAETGNVTFEVNDAEGPVESAEVFLYVEAELYGEESNYIAETGEAGVANVTDIPLSEAYHYHYRVYKTGYQGIDVLHGPIEEDVTIDDIVLKEAEDTFNLTIEEPENEGILWIQNIGTERVDPETWPFEREYSNNTVVNVFMDSDMENKSAPYKMYQDGGLVHDSFENAHWPAQLEITENITLEPHFTDLNHFVAQIEGEGNITVEGRIEPYDEDFMELESIEDQEADFVPEVAEYKLTAVPEEGHEFVEWYDEKENETYSENRTLTQHFEEDTNITSKFRTETHDVNFTLKDEDSDMLRINGAQVELTCNETGEVKYEIESEDEGTADFDNITEGEYQYTITHKEYEEKTGNITVDEYIEKDIYLESLPTYRLEIDQLAPAFEEVGTIKITAHGETKERDHNSITIDYSEGTELEIKAIPPEDLEFSHWEEDYPENKSEEKSFNLTMYEDKNLTVHYEDINLYGLGIDAVGEGTVYMEDNMVDMPFGDEYTAGTELTLTAEPTVDWHFFQWHREDPDTEEIYTYSHEEEINITLDEDYILVPEFREHSFVLNIEGEGKVIMEVYEDDTWKEHPDSPIDDKLSTYGNSGTDVKLTAEPSEGYVFSEWTNHTDQNRDRTFTLDEDMDITAIFEELAYDVNITVSEKGLDIGLIIDASVELRDIETNEVLHEGYTNDKGMVRFTDVVEGDYEYILNHESYNETTGAISVDGDEDFELDLEPIDQEHHRLEINQYPTFGREGYLEITANDETGTYDQNSVTKDFVEGTEVELTAVNEGDWLFSSWDGDIPEEQSEDSTLEITMDEDKDIDLHFEEVDDDVEEFKLTLHIEGNGVIDYRFSEDPIDEDENDDTWEFTLEEGTTVNLEVDEDHEDDFERWDLPEELEDDFDEEDLAIEFDIENDVEITANFEEAIPGYTFLAMVLGMIVAIAVHSKKRYN